MRKNVRSMTMKLNTSALCLGLLASMIGWVPLATANSPQNSSQNSAIDQKIARHAQAHGVPVPLARAVVRLESNFRPTAANKGNFGLMQIRLGTARSLGYQGGAAGLLDADTNLTFGMKYLAQAYRLAGGDTCGTIMRYQSGHRATRASSANRAYCGRAKMLMARAN
jgi:soluble lytic murein transglycosylase-like protein